MEDSSIETCRQPVFIVGCPRSGTTFLQALLSTDSRLIIPPEDDFILRLKAELHDYRDEPLRPQEVSALLDDLYVPRHAFANWDLPRDRLADRLAHVTVMTPRQFVEEVHQAYLSRHPGKSRWGCKVPYFASHLQELAAIFPEGKFIHLIRDGRDTYLSMQDRNAKGAKHFPTTATRAARVWSRLVTAAADAGQKLQSRFLQVKYEELVTDVEPTLRTVCDFVEEPFKPERLQHYYEDLERQQYRRQVELDRYVKRKIDPTNTERWQREMTGDDLYAYEQIAGRQLVRFGYLCSDHPQRVSAKTRLRTAICKRVYEVWDHRPSAKLPP